MHKSVKHRQDPDLFRCSESTPKLRPTVSKQLPKLFLFVISRLFTSDPKVIPRSLSQITDGSPVTDSWWKFPSPRNVFGEKTNSSLLIFTNRRKEKCRLNFQWSEIFRSDGPEFIWISSIIYSPYETYSHLNEKGYWPAWTVTKRHAVLPTGCSGG